MLDFLSVTPQKWGWYTVAIHRGPSSSYNYPCWHFFYEKYIFSKIQKSHKQSTFIYMYNYALLPTSWYVTQ